jgi:hypothetical protein
MFLFRLLFLLAVLTIAGSAVLYLFTGHRRYIAFAWRLARYCLGISLFFLALLVIERIGLVPF